MTFVRKKERKMVQPQNKLEEEIEIAFHYRGHANLKFKDGRLIEGYLYNREFTNPKVAKDRFVEIFLKGSGDPEVYSIDELESVSLSGKDYAAGESYQEWLAKYESKKQTKEAF